MNETRRETHYIVQLVSDKTVFMVTIPIRSPAIAHASRVQDAIFDYMSNILQPFLSKVG